MDLVTARMPKWCKNQALRELKYEVPKDKEQGIMRLYDHRELLAAANHTEVKISVRQTKDGRWEFEFETEKGVFGFKGTRNREVLRFRDLGKAVKKVWKLFAGAGFSAPDILIKSD